MSSPEYEPYFSPEYGDEEEIVAMNGKVLFLLPENTHLRRFEHEDSSFDRLCHIQANGKPTEVSLDQINKVDAELVDRLEAKGFQVQTISMAEPIDI